MYESFSANYTLCMYTHIVTFVSMKLVIKGDLIIVKNIKYCLTLNKNYFLDLLTITILFLLYFVHDAEVCALL